MKSNQMKSNQIKFFENIDLDRAAGAGAAAAAAKSIGF
jgi:hypothetical protein